MLTTYDETNARLYDAGWLAGWHVSLSNTAPAGSDSSIAAWPQEDVGRLLRLPAGSWLPMPPGLHRLRHSGPESAPPRRFPLGCLRPARPAALGRRVAAGVAGRAAADGLEQRRHGPTHRDTIFLLSSAMAEEW